MHREKNGCLYLFPGSHKLGLLKNTERKSYLANSKPGNTVKDKYNKSSKIDLLAKKGDLLIMVGECIHGSYGNFSKKNNNRHMISFNYGKKNSKFFPGRVAKRANIAF